jgi:hypothetical protein
MTKTSRLVWSLLLLSAAVPAQQYTISTFAGGGAPVPVPIRGVDLPLDFNYYSNIAADAASNAYFVSANSVLRLDQNGMVTRVAGNGRIGYSGDGGPAALAQLSDSLGGIAVDGAGNLCIADSGNGRLRRVSPSGIMTTVAGDGTTGQFPG